MQSLKVQFALHVFIKFIISTKYWFQLLLNSLVTYSVYFKLYLKLKEHQNKSLHKAKPSTNVC